MRTRLVLGTVLVVMMVSMTGAARTTPLASFSAAADSFTVLNTVRVGQVLPLPVELYVPHSRVRIDSGPWAEGYAGIEDAPLQQLLFIFGLPTPPTFCMANYPGEAEVSCRFSSAGEVPGGNPAGMPPTPPLPALPADVELAGGGGRATATGDPEDPEAVAAWSTVATTDVVAPEISVGATRATSSAEVQDGVAVAHTEIQTTDVVIAGVLRITGVGSVASAEAGGVPGSAQSMGELRIGGMTVAGQDIELTERGFEVAGQVVSIDAPLGVARTVAQQLQGNGITLGPLDPVERVDAPDGTGSSVVVPGLRVRVDTPDGNFQELQIGGARASATAVTGSTAGPDGRAVPSGAGSGSAGTPVVGARPQAMVQSAGADSDGGEASVEPSTAILDPAPSTGTEAARPAPGSDLVARRLRTVYGGGVLAALLVFLVCGLAVARGGPWQRAWFRVIPKER